MTHQFIEQPDVTPMGIINRAVASGIDPDQLEKLLSLQERWEANEARKAYNLAMKACQEAMPVVVTDSENTHTRSRYASLEAVTKTIKPIYTKYGFSLSYGSEQSDVPDHIVVTCDCMHIDGHTERRTLLCPYDNTGAQGKSTKTAIQGMGSSVAYGRRYLKLMLFDVSISDEDDDGSAGVVAKISDNEARELDHWYSQIPESSQKPFLDWIGAEKVENIKAADFTKALEMLKRKVSQLEKR